MHIMQIHGEYSGMHWFMCMRAAEPRCPSTVNQMFPYMVKSTSEMLS